MAIGNKTLKSKNPFRMYRQLVKEAIKIFITNAVGLITALFILINSSFGLLGNYSSVQNLPDQLPLFIGATLIGALIGTTLGIKFYTANTIKKALALVLVIAGFKLLLT